MKSSETIALPVTTLSYDAGNEQTTRRTIEHAFEDLRNDVIDSRDMTDKVASLSQRRAQFLLMGA